jgi:hypothetical protein
MDAQRKTSARDDVQDRARRSHRIHAFLGAWAKRHWPERVTRFAKR